jgi:dipeptidyl-peptidase-4
VRRISQRLSVWFFLVSLSFSQSSQKQLTIESIFAEGGITGRGPENIKWSPDNSKFSFIQRDDTGEHGQLWVVDATAGDKKVLLNEVKLAALAPPLSQLKDDRARDRITRYHIPAYLWSPDSKHLLFTPEGRLWLFTVDNGTAIQISSEPDGVFDPKFSPDGTRISYVRKHNLYIHPLKGSEQEITRDKDENILNGEVDWVYAEELAVRSNYFWSPDGHELAYLQMDETQVPTYPLTDWLPTNAKVDLEKYPKAGDPNPSVRIGVISASGGKTKWVQLGSDPNLYIPRFGWIRNGLLWAQLLNRTQDTMELYFIDARTGRTRRVLTETAPDGWVNVNDDFNLLKGDHFVWTSWRDGHNHIYLYSFDKENPLGADAYMERQLTKGEFEVLSVDSVDATNGVVYFTCNKDDARQQQLYSVRLDGTSMTRVSAEPGTHAPSFADNSQRYVDEFTATLTPPRLSVCEVSGSCRPVWESNAVEQFGLLKPQFLEFKADDGTTLYGELLLPPGQSEGKVPVIDYIYGGPASQLVRDTWIGTTGLFHQIMAQKGFAIFTVDNRGTPGRDRKFQTAIRHQFGVIELKDQVAALDQLFARFPQLDRTRVGMWGWSNGGAMTLYSLTHSELFKAGVSVAPVSDWHLYDSIYTERYMGLPDENAKAYEESSAPKNAGNLHGALLLAHGSSDDNVHFQNSVQMIEALIRAGKQFRFMAYPNKTHGIGGAADRDHLFHLIQDHFERELK